MPAAQLTTSDGVRLAADLAEPSAETAAVGAVVVCHPHPQHGGNRFNTVVTAVFERLPAAGFVTLRFDFRHEFGGGVAERLDVAAALDALDALDAAADVPRFVVGYSFGALVALTTDDARIAAVVAVAPPLGHAAVPPPCRPTLLLVPEHDQFCPPASARAASADWPDTRLEVIGSADHFVAGRTGAVADLTADWLTTRIRRAPGRSRP